MKTFSLRGAARKKNTEQDETVPIQFRVGFVPRQFCVFISFPSPMNILHTITQKVLGRKTQDTGSAREDNHASTETVSAAEMSSADFSVEAIPLEPLSSETQKKDSRKTDSVAHGREHDDSD